MAVSYEQRLSRVRAARAILRRAAFAFFAESALLARLENTFTIARNILKRVQSNSID